MSVLSQLIHPPYNFVFSVEIFDTIFKVLDLRIISDRTTLHILLSVSKHFYNLAFLYAYQVVFLKGSLSCLTLFSLLWLVFPIKPTLVCIEQLDILFFSGSSHQD